MIDQLLIPPGITVPLAHTGGLLLIIFMQFKPKVPLTVKNRSITGTCAVAPMLTEVPLVTLDYRSGSLDSRLMRKLE